MSSKDRTTSVKLDPEIRIRLNMLAGVRHRSAHSIMK
jgi:predicted transcriptional regulator